MITHVVPIPTSAGNEIRILHLARWLKRAGFKIVVLFKGQRVDRKTRAALKSVFDDVYWSDPHGLFRKGAFAGRDETQLSKKEAMASPRMIQMAERLCQRHKPHAVIAEYIFTAPCLDHLPPGPLKIIDTHDVFSRKEALVQAYGIDDPFSCSEEEERSYLLKADLILAIQRNEEAMLQKLVPERRVITTGIDFEVPANLDTGKTTPGTVLVVGSDNPLNVHGLRAFLEHAWPRVHQRIPRTTLRIVGKVAHHVESADPSVVSLGWVPDLDEEYRRAEIVINPTVAGTGLKIKSVEALCRGKVLVGTPNSVDGMHYHGTAPFAVADNWSTFSETMCRLLENASEREALQERALHYARTTFNTDSVYGPLSGILNEYVASAYR